MRVLSMKQYVVNNITICLLITILYSSFTNAAFVLNGTRFIYQEGADSTSIQVNNNSNSDYAGQAWIENIDKESKVSFVSLPSFFELKSEESQLLRLIKVRDNLPEDRESLFWLNVQEIPQIDKRATNKMVVAINTRVKLLYRPKALQPERKDAENKISYFLDKKNGKVRLKNPTGYYFAIQSLQHLGKELSLDIKNGILEPYSEVDIKGLQSIPTNLVLEAIDDYGAVNNFLISPLGN